MPAMHEFVVMGTDHCVDQPSVQIDIRSNPEGVQIVRQQGAWTHVLNTGEQPMGLLLETDQSVSLIINDPVEEAITWSLLIPIRLQGSEYYSVFPNIFGIERFLISAVTLATNARVQMRIRQTENYTTDEVIVADMMSIEAFLVSKSYDISGSRILSDRKIAVSCMFRKPAYMGVIQMVPVKVLGKRFVMMPYVYETERKVRIVTAYNSTSISGLNTTQKTDCLPRGHVVAFNLTSRGWNDTSIFHANRPLLILETIVDINTTFFLNPVEHYKTYITDSVYTWNPDFMECAFICFNPTDLNFTMTIMDVKYFTETTAVFSLLSAYHDTGGITSTSVYLNKSINVYGVINITYGDAFFGSCSIWEGEGLFFIQPLHNLEAIYKVIIYPKEKLAIQVKYRYRITWRRQIKKT